MQKKLRVRFLLICWGLLTVFFAAIAAGIGWALYNSAVRDSEDALEAAAEADGTAATTWLRHIRLPS